MRGGRGGWLAGDFFAELERNVYKATVAYAVVTSLLIQLVIALVISG